MVEKKKIFFDGKDNKIKMQKLLGSVYGGFSSREAELKKTEKIIAQMNSGTLDFTSTTWYSPELTPDMWLMPKSRQETLRWVRLFYSLDPYIHAIVNMHALYPFSMFEITAENEAVTKFYKQMAFNRNFNLYDFILKASLSYQKFGEAIMMGIKDEQEFELKSKKVRFTKWSRFVLFEPEFIEVRQAFFEKEPRYYLQITPTMKEEAKEAKRLGREVTEGLDDLLRQNEILLDNQNISAIMNLTDASALRGTSPIQCLLRTLLFQDKIAMLKLTAIDRFRYPIEIWKIGDISADPPKIPNDEELMKFEQFIKQAKNNPPFSIFVPPFVNYEVVGFNGQESLFSYKEDYEWIRDSILVGLGVSKDIVLGEVKGWTNTKQITLQKLIMMYQAVQDKFTNWLINNYFTPIAEANNFYTKNKDLDLPRIEWQKKLNIDKDETEDYMNMWEKGLISTRTLFTKYKSLDYEAEQVKLKKEIGSVFDDGQRIKIGNRSPLAESEITPPEGEFSESANETSTSESNKIETPEAETLEKPETEKTETSETTEPGKPEEPTIV